MTYFWMAIVTLAVLQVSVLLTTIYLHRALAHRALDLNPAVALLMHIHLTMFTGMIPREWVAVHRKHHHFSDKEGDPHSPYLFGLWKVLFGNYFYYRREASKAETVSKYTPQWNNDLLDRVPMAQYGVLLGLAFFAFLFGWAWGLAAWVFHIVAYILLNSSINSVCHMIGYRNFENKATNLRWLALITGGEGLHNNHHQHPASARMSFGRLELDPAWPVIRLLALLRLARVQRLPAAA